MVLVGAESSLVNAVSTKIEVSHIANATVPMNIWDRIIAIIATDGEICPRRRGILGGCTTERFDLLGDVGMLSEKVFPVSEKSGYWSLIIGLLLGSLVFWSPVFLLEHRFGSFRKLAVVRHGPTVRLLW